MQRGLFVFRFAQRVSDLAHFSIHAGAGDNSFAAAVDDRGAGIQHVFAVAERHVFLAFLQIERFDQLGHGHAFTCQRSLLHFHGVAFKDAAVGRHSVAGFQHDHVAHNEVFAFDCCDLAVAQNVRGGGGHLHQRLHRCLGLAFLDETHDGVDDDHSENDQHVGEF